MDFKTLLQSIHEARSSSEAFGRTGQNVTKERVTSGAPDKRAKDAARKRAERARQVPRDKQSKEQLVKQVIVVKTRDGKIQLIFKDSFNPDTHTKVSEKEMSVSEAQQVASNPKFEQTRASILLFGDVKGKKETEPEKKEKGKEEKPEGKEPVKGEEAPKKQKARKLSQEEMYASLSQMTPEQLATVPPEIRQEYFKANRKVVSNTKFDNISDSYEKISNAFGINTNTTIPYNQQVLNAFMFLAKIKAGASDQELQTYSLLAGNAMEFTKMAFLQAKKLLSQVGDECIQNLVSSAELQQTSVDSAGASDMGCGNFRFKISAGGEIALSTKSFDQSNKTFRGYLANSLYKSLQNEFANPTDEKMQENVAKMNAETAEFGEQLISQQTLQQIQSNPELMQKLQNVEVIDSMGQSKGMLIDENGNLNPYASIENYQQTIEKYTKSIISGAKVNKSQMMQNVSSDLLKTVLRGDQLVDPMIAPTHLVTANGVFPISDDYIAEISKTADFDMKPAKELISSSNIEVYKPSAASTLKNYRTVIEQKQPKIDVKDILVPKQQVDPIKILVSNALTKYDFDFNASLLPGFSPKDLNTVKYNYVTIGKKTIKIPVANSETATVSQILGESYSYVNDILIESLTNNFILVNMHRTNLISDAERAILDRGPIELYENYEVAEINLIKIFENILQRVVEDPTTLLDFHKITYGDLSEETKRDYKKEYRNYHGKAKQRKERSARTKARELMKKKGIVKKGDGKDIDHRRPLRSGGSNGINNLRVRNKSANRADNGHRKGEKQNKDWK
jgi:hypothetical protein